MSVVLFQSRLSQQLTYLLQASEPWPSVRKYTMISPNCLLTKYYMQNFTAPDELMQAKSQKQLVLTGAARFNAKPKNGLVFLEEHGLIYSDLSPEVSKARSLAIFLKNCTRLDKRLLGDFISKPDNIEVLKAFIGLFDFKNVSQAHIVLLLFLIFATVETMRRRDAGNARGFPAPWRSTTDRSHYRNICVYLLCIFTG